MYVIQTADGRYLMGFTVVGGVYQPYYTSDVRAAMTFRNADNAKFLAEQIETRTHSVTEQKQQV